LVPDHQKPVDKFVRAVRRRLEPGVIDVLRWRAWAFFFVVIGANAVTAYLLPDVIDFKRIGHFFLGGMERHARAFGPVVAALGVLAAEWLLLLYLYRRRLFLRV
jgi:hypothetical protein